MTAWYIWRETGPAGPMSNQDLAQSIKGGAIGRDDWLWHDRLGHWTVAGEIDFLWPEPPSEATVKTDAKISGDRPGQAGSPVSRPTVTSKQAGDAPSLTALYLRRRDLHRGQASRKTQAAAAPGDAPTVPRRQTPPPLPSPDGGAPARDRANPQPPPLPGH